MKAPSYFIILCISLLNFVSKAQVIYNGYAKVTAVSGSSALTVNNVNQVNHSFAVGQYVIVMQMQDNVIGTNTTNAVSFGNLSNIQNTGRFEVALVSALSPAGTPTRITLASPLLNTYNTGANSAVQVITFRRLSPAAFTTSANITGLAWNGNIGGVIALEVPTILTLGHSISANGLGFAGGVKNTPNGYTGCESVTYATAIATRYAGKGEGIYNNTTTAFEGARGKILTGGGGGNDVNAGGGGGGNFTAGGNGGIGWTGGAGCNPSASGLGGISLNGNISPSRVYMGGGGGGGHENDGVGTVGGSGGGIILLKTGTLATTGTCGGGLSITANGSTAASAANDGSGGGGAGSIVMQVNSYSIVPGCTLALTSNGGGGGSSITGGGTHGGGGGGGQGVVIFSGAQPTINVSVNTIPGQGGSSCTGCGAVENGQAGGGPNNSGILTNSTGVLPIELLSFTAENMEDKVALNWVTITERNTDYFSIERSTDAQTWEQVGKQKAAENSNTRLYYTDEDTSPVNGISYYRLITLNLDGSKDESPVQMVDRSNKNDYLLLYPNPTGGILQIVSSSAIQATQCEVYDVAGKKISAAFTQVSGSKLILDLSAAEHGVYFLTIQTKNGGLKSNKIIVK